MPLLIKSTFPFPGIWMLFTEASVFRLHTHTLIALLILCKQTQEIIENLSSFLDLSLVVRRDSWSLKFFVLMTLDPTSSADVFQNPT